MNLATPYDVSTNLFFQFGGEKEEQHTKCFRLGSPWGPPRNLCKRAGSMNIQPFIQRHQPQMQTQKMYKSPIMLMKSHLKKIL